MSNFIKEAMEKLSSIAIPDDIKKFVLSSMINTAVALKNAEDETMRTKDISHSVEQSISGGGSLLEALKGGIVNEQTKKYAEQYKQILREADKIAEEKYGQSFFSTSPIFAKEEISKKLLAEEQRIKESYDYVVKNKKTCINELNAVRGIEPPKYKYDIVVFNKYANNLQEYINHIYIKQKNDTHYTIILNIPREKSHTNNLKLLINSEVIQYYHNYEYIKMKLVSFVSQHMNNNSYLSLEFIAHQI